MVKIVENWSLLQGRIVNVAPASEVQGFSTVSIDVVASEPVDGFPNMLEREVGQRVSVHVPTQAANTMTIGEDVRMRVRRAGGNRVFSAVD